MLSLTTSARPSTWGDVSRDVVFNNPNPMKRLRSENGPERPHVCMVVHSRYAPGEPRGERAARAAVEAGYSVDVICLRSPHEVEFETVEGIQIRRLPVQHIRGAGALRSLNEYLGFTLRASIAALRIHRERSIDVVYVHAPPDFLIVTALLPRLLGSRVVLDIHDLSPHLFNARFGGKRWARPLERILRTVE